METEHIKTKKNNLNTKNIPPLMMLSAGFIAIIICCVLGYEIKKMLTVVLLTLFIFAILGTVIKTIVDGFNMNMDYDSFLESEGEVYRKDKED